MKTLHNHYKSHRKYVHGPDIYNVMYEVFENEFNGIPSSSKLSSRKLAQNNLAYTRSKSPGNTVYSIFEASTDDENIVYYLYETDVKITSHVEYDESDIVENAQFNLKSKEGNIFNYNRYSISEISVALLKELCNKIISNSVKWIFVQIHFSQPVAIYTREPIKVTIEKNIGNKMVVGSIALNGREIGGLKFSSK